MTMFTMRGRTQIRNTSFLEDPWAKMNPCLFNRFRIASWKRNNVERWAKTGIYTSLEERRKERNLTKFQLKKFWQQSRSPRQPRPQSKSQEQVPKMSGAGGQLMQRPRFTEEELHQITSIRDFLFFGFIGITSETCDAVTAENLQFAKRIRRSAFAYSCGAIPPSARVRGGGEACRRPI